MLWHACGKWCTTILLLLALRAALHFILRCSTISMEIHCCLSSGTWAASGQGPGQQQHVLMHSFLSPPWGIGAARDLRREAMEVDAVWRKRTPKRQTESLRTVAPEGDDVWRGRLPTRQPKNLTREASSVRPVGGAQGGGKTRGLPSRTSTSPYLVVLYPCLSACARQALHAVRFASLVVFAFKGVSACRQTL